MGSIHALLQRLQNEKVEFILVGGLAAIAHGSASVTEDVDVFVRFDDVTVRGILRALAGTNPRERMNVQRTPLGDDPARFVGNRNLYVTCSEGVIDFLGELTGLGAWAEVNARAVVLTINTLQLRVLSLDDLITSKRSVGRPKDQRVARELELVRDRTRR